ncbi:AdoMet-dependent rRNA methyltransferase spb1 [Apophysomyces ossiformis]|uniref:AdoMet-dependent rRNA methyltransferase spb1 n=1 Tax=Apophysomyces ossiformis TaxID=679940 RepID=A0A8H7C013_9FUNG|nr:AdoMet-dependent rRNA methyltransferase spb1 [Apophysomyces ossiformis]
MGKGRDKKSSKGRLDKYYHLAKEQGYRARSAFKLIQLNKKYNFLEKSRVLIDLCAAPGGWLQVATKYMPQSSLIIGVDLAPIKPIPGVITFQDDITTDRCRQNLRQEMKTWKADVVLHDGAPNVGTAWAQDAYSQSELVLVSLKLASEFLAKGGTFVTKVFRSKDYNKLLWVFQQLFRKVEATKPPSSRNVSAEIFVVCHDFLAPKKLDPRFLDPKAVFSEVDQDEPTKMTDIFKPEKKRRQREGYEEGNYTLHKKADAMEFIKAQDPIAVLGTYNQLVFDSDEARELLKKSITTDEIKANCEDLKVLGKRDFKELLKWRTAIREEYKLDKKEEKKETVVVEEEPVDEDELIQEELENLTKEEAAKRKREKRKANEKKMKLIQRMQLNMIVPNDIGLEQGGPDGQTLFNIKKIDKDESLQRLQEGDMSIADDLDQEMDDDDINVGKEVKGRIAEMDAELDNSDVDSDYDLELEEQLDAEYERYKTRKAERDAKFRAKQLREEDDEWKGFDSKKKQKDTDDSDSDSDSDSESDGEQEEEASDSESDMERDDEEPVSKSVRSRTTTKASGNSLLNDLGKKAELSSKTKNGLTKGASMFFDQDLFKGVDLSEEEDEEEEDHEDQNDSEEEAELLVGSRKRKAEDVGVAEEILCSTFAYMSKQELDEDQDEDSDFEVPATEDNVSSDDEMWHGEEDDNSKAMREALENGLVTAEAITLARQLVNKEKSKQDLIDEGFTREAFREKTGLPDWFLDDENKHNKPNMPITKEAVRALREKLKALDARPIKKIAEAKARKKYKATMMAYTMKRLQKAQKKATDIADNPDMSEKEKLASINKLIQRSTKSKPKKEIKLVVAKGANRGIKGRPNGVKGRYKMVDPRMKKELRAQKRKEKKKGSRRK